MSKLSDQELETLYNDFLDECYGDVVIMTYPYPTSHALKLVDPTAYKVGFSDWLDSQLEETIFEKDNEYYDNEDCEDENE